MSEQNSPAIAATTFFRSGADAIDRAVKDGEPLALIFEVNTFKLVEGADEAAFLAVAARVEEKLSEVDGYLCRQLMKTEDGNWLDLVAWTSADKAKAALAMMQSVVMSDEALSPFFTLIDPESITMRHFSPQ